MHIAIFISGSGTTMERVIKACQSGKIDGQVMLVVASRGSCGGIAKAKTLGVPTVVIKLKQDYNGDEVEFGRAIIRLCYKHNIDLIAQLGWLVKTPDNVINTYQDMIINQHPGPLDPGRLGFGGKGMHGQAVHEAVLRFSRAINRTFKTEATVHRVTGIYDNGSLLGIHLMDILPTDTAETLAARLLPIEHQLVVETIQLFATGRVEEIVRPVPLIRLEEEQIFHKIINQVTTTTH
ncbi:MAG: formyltransferase family protein [Patescibacteria group bacterium]